MAEIVDLNGENYDATVEQDGIVVVDAWAAWCSPCHQFAPVFTKAAEEYPQHTFAKLDTMTNMDLVKSLSIEQIPTLMIYRDGIMLYHQATSPSAETLADLIGQVENLDMDVVRADIAAEKAKENGA